LRIYQGVRVECPHGQPPHTGNPLAVGEHGATVPPRHSAWQRPLHAAGCRHGGLAGVRPRAVAADSTVGGGAGVHHA
jgi:hypothetical protein